MATDLGSVTEDLQRCVESYNDLSQYLTATFQYRIDDMKAMARTGMKRYLLRSVDKEMYDRLYIYLINNSRIVKGGSFEMKKGTKPSYHGDRKSDYQLWFVLD